MQMHEFLLRKARWVAKHPANREVLSRGELFSVAIVLNKPRWLAEAGFTLADALERLGPDDVMRAVSVARDLHKQEVV